MADVIKKEDLEEFVGLARELIEKGSFSPIEIIKNIRLKTGCSLAEAKESYTLANTNETLGQYQERVILPLVEELDEFEKQNRSE